MNREESKEITPIIISKAFKDILSGKEYKMLPMLAVSAYSVICRKLGLVPTKLKLNDEDAGTENKDTRGSPRS